MSNFGVSSDLPTENPAGAAAAGASGEAGGAPLGVHAARGAVWTFLQMVGSKLISMVALFFLGRLLTDDMYGVFAAGGIVVSFVALMPRFFMTEVLVRRQGRFERLVNPAFWLSLAMAAQGAVTILAVSPLAGAWHHNPQVMQVMMLLALQWPIDALAACPLARLQIDLRFRAIATIAFLANAVMSASQIAMAYAGFGPFALVVPRMLMTVVLTVSYWYLAPVPVKRTPDAGRWRMLFGDGLALSLSAYFESVLYLGDNLALSILRPPAVLGLYYFSFNLSTQALQLLAANIAPMLMSVLSKLQHDTRRQAEAFLRAARSLNLATMFLCLLLAAVAKPLLHLLWGAKWDQAIPVVQVLGIGMSFVALTGGVRALLQAQGRFRFLMKLQLVLACAYLAGVVTAALIGGALSVAIAVCLFYVISTPATVYVAVRPAGIGVGRVIGVYATPLLASLAACAVPWGLVEYLTRAQLWHMPERPANFAACALTGLVATPLYVLLIRFLWPHDFAALVDHLKPYVPRLLRL